MKAVVFHGIGDIRLDTVSDPAIAAPTDAIVRITSSAICGTDLHMIRGTMPGMEPGTVLGHEGVGIVEEVGANVRNLRRGDRVVIPSTIACGHCSYCRSGYQAQCDTANPHGPLGGTSFFGGPEPTGPFDGLQAEYARIPFAHAGLVKLPDAIDDDRAILLSDIFPTGYFGADLAEISEGDTVAVFGCGPVGQFALLGAKLLGADRIIAVDGIPDRLEMARGQGAEVVNFNEEDPVEAIRALTGGVGVDRAVDAVGVDAQAPAAGPAAPDEAGRAQAHKDRQMAAPESHPKGELWQPGDSPLQASRWAVDALARAGALSIIGVYPQQVEAFPIGIAMNKTLTMRMGNCNHRRYLPHLVEMVRSGQVDPLDILTKVEPLTEVLDAYKAFDLRQPGWMKVKLAA